MSVIELDSTTKEILANFSTINPSLLFREGNSLRTISPGYDIIAIANVVETFPKDFGIYDLSRFLGVVSLFDTAKITFGKDSLTIKDNKDKDRKINYVYADASMILVAPEDDIDMPDTVAEFPVTGQMLKDLSKAIGSLRLPEVVFKGDGSAIELVVKDMKNTAAGPKDSYTQALGKTDKIFESVFKVEKIQKLKEDDYTVTIAYGDVGQGEKAGLASFESKNVKYFITPEETSSYSV